MSHKEITAQIAPTRVAHSTTVFTVASGEAHQLPGLLVANTHNCKHHDLNSGDTPLVLLCPAWKRWGTARAVKQNTTILHPRADDVVQFADSEELVRNSALPASALVEVGDDHRLADPEPLRKMLEACEGGTGGPTP